MTLHYTNEYENGLIESAEKSNHIGHLLEIIGDYDLMLQEWVEAAAIIDCKTPLKLVEFIQKLKDDRKI